jgi:cation transport ATPase
VSFCPKCGKKITEDMVFCPNCGAALNVDRAGPQPERAVTYRHEKDEKREKTVEKREKHEKHEKHEYAFVGPLVGGLVLVFIGLSIYLSVEEVTSAVPAMLWAVFFIFIGVVIIIGAVYAAFMASRRHPRT